MKVAVLIMMFLITSVFARAAIIASSLIENNGEWNSGTRAPQFLDPKPFGFDPTAGITTLSFSNNPAGSGTNFITFTGTPLAVGDYTP